VRERTGRLVLVLPFENRSGQPALNWIADSFPDTLDQRLNSAGFLTITRDDRLFALDHLGFPADFRPSRATTLRVAQTLDADYVIVGSYTTTVGGAQHIAVQAQVLEVNRLRMSLPTQVDAPLDQLLPVENRIAWRVAREMDPKMAVAEQTFVAASGDVQLTAFENYIRGIDATTPEERLQRLKTSVKVDPSYTAAVLALGKTEYAERQFGPAATTLAAVPPTDPLALEANFFRGLALFNQTKYAESESAFAFVAARLPLPEVVNNQGVTESRQGRNAVPLFQRASSTDPNDEDYHYNYAVALWRTGDLAGATREVAAALKLRANDTEAAELRAHLRTRPTNPQPQPQGGALKPAASDSGDDDFDPQTRIRRTYSEASFRQAAFQMDQMRAMRLATLPPAQQSAEYAKMAQDYLTQGFLPEAERDFEAAITADPNDPAAHAGLAQVRERSGNVAEARSEAQRSLQLRPNVDAYLTLARLDLQANQLAASAADVGNALRLEPKNGAALGMRQALVQRGQTVPQTVPQTNPKSVP
jgi:tetratricopeptide (TPR) repeat protein